MGILGFKSSKSELKKPYINFYTKKENKLKIPNCSIYERMKDVALKYSRLVAINYYGTKITYSELDKKIDKCAKAFKSIGVKQEDVVTICMPNIPEAIVAFYALNKIGAIANMIHPLSAEEEIKNYINSTNSKILLMIDLCYEKVDRIIRDTEVYKVIVGSVADSMRDVMRIGYQFTKGYKIKKPQRNNFYVYWKDFLLQGINYNGKDVVKSSKDSPAVIMHSGGTTGSPKGILLSNANFNAIVEQAKVIADLKPDKNILAILPVFHGFGLAINIHIPLCYGVTLDLLPTFDARKIEKLFLKYRPNFVVGVPTLFEAMVNNKKLDKMDLSYLETVVCGGDALKSELNEKINLFLRIHGTNIKIIQGYGMTEATAAVCVAVRNANKFGSIGIPLPGNLMKIVKPETNIEVPYGEEGEICISGPSVMLGYLNNEKETNEVLQIHDDGRIWLHSGDLGIMDEDGVVFYKQRLKRMIVSSGYNVYPSQVESVIEQHKEVLKCTCVGIPHPYKQQVVKAVIVLKDGKEVTYQIKKEIMDLCEKNLFKLAIPYKYEFRKSIPVTRIGKVNYRELEKDE